LRVERTVHLDSLSGIEATGIAGAATLFAEGGATQGRFRCGPAVVPVRGASCCGPAIIDYSNNSYIASSFFVASELRERVIRNRVAC
jgi:hypothetical protein